MHRFSIRHILVILWWLGLWPHDAPAQDVSGSVRDAVTHAPLSGAAVLLLGPGGETISRTVSSSSGTFRVRGDGGVSVRILRIGYAPRDRRLDSSTTYAIELTPLGTTLRAVAVRSSAVCPTRRDQQEALAWWSTATDALLSLVIAAESSGDSGSVTQMVYDRLLSSDGRRIVRQSTRMLRTANANPIRAGRPPDAFVRDGYVETSGDVMTYYGPDAGVLLDSSFAATHCLSLRADHQKPDQIGIGFAPARNRDSVPDIAGVLWLARQPVALVSLEFEYRGVDQAILDMRAGGRLDFETLADGVPIVRTWHIRSPKLRFLPTGRVVRGRVVADGAMADVMEVHETGGLVVEGRLTDGTIVSAPLATLGGRVLNARTDEPVPGAVLALDSTDVMTVTDSAGQFSFERLLPGPYTLRVKDSVTVFGVRLDSLGEIAPDSSVQQVVRRVSTREVRTALGVVTPVDVRLAWRARVSGCGAGEDVERRFVVMGVVLTADSTPVANAHVLLSWADSSRGSTMATSVEAVADSGGGFFMCGIPAGRTLATRIAVPGKGEYLGTTTVSRVDYDAQGRRRTGTLRAVKLVISQNDRDRP